MQNDVISASRRSDDRKTPRTERYMERTFCGKIRADPAPRATKHSIRNNVRANQIVPQKNRAAAAAAPRVTKRSLKSDTIYNQFMVILF